ncbi:MAG: ion channel [Thiogranum sp.]
MLLEALIWALFYLYNPVITTLPDLETALYFSMVTFTSVGYGDLVITGDWRMLASLGGNGVIIFGWTTALIFYVIQHVYRPR